MRDQAPHPTSYEHSPQPNIRPPPQNPAVLQIADGVFSYQRNQRHFTLQIADGVFSYQRNQRQIDEEALLVGIYVLRTRRAGWPDRRRCGRARLQAAQSQRAIVSADENAA